MGTMLLSHGASFNQCFDELNLSDTAVVMDVNQANIDAGVQLILTNTFGASRFKLSNHGRETWLTEINRDGVDLAKRATAASGKEVFIGSDVGPLGVRIAPGWARAY